MRQNSTSNASNGVKFPSLAEYFWSLIKLSSATGFKFVLILIAKKMVIFQYYLNYKFLEKFHLFNMSTTLSALTAAFDSICIWAKFW